MSTLNLALMNVSLSRLALPDGYESLVGSKKTLAEVRELITLKPEIKPLLRDAMQDPISKVAGRFSHMEMKGEPIRIAIPASDDDISSHFKILNFIEPNISLDKLNKEMLDR